MIRSLMNFILSVWKKSNLATYECPSAVDEQQLKDLHMPIIEEPLKKRLRQQAFLGSSINRLGARLASDVVMM